MINTMYIKNTIFVEIKGNLGGRCPTNRLNYCDSHHIMVSVPDYHEQQSNQ